MRGVNPQDKARFGANINHLLSRVENKGEALERDFKIQTHWIATDDAQKLALHELQSPSEEEMEFPILMLHGAIENSKIFYSSSGKGFGPFLAKAGYKVFALDYRGRGQSLPKISRESTYGQLEVIEIDIPMAIDYVLNETQRDKLLVVAHSWGGVLLSASMARDPSLTDKVLSTCYIGTKRSVDVGTLEALFKVYFMWNRASYLLSFLDGYFDAPKYRFGSDSETRKSHDESVFWVKDSKSWIDPRDAFNYKEAYKEIKHPPILSITGSKDFALGHPIDCQRFLNEVTGGGQKIKIIGKKYGYQANYDHIDILTSSLGEKDHFLEMLQWLNQFSGTSIKEQVS